MIAPMMRLAGAEVCGHDPTTDAKPAGGHTEALG